MRRVKVGNERKRTMFRDYIEEVAHNPLIILTAAAITLDTILGLFRAIKEKKFNSNFGIDGAIRKSAMLISVLFLMFADMVVKINCIGFLSEDFRALIHIEKIGMGEFFAILFILYEAVSILKNLYLCGAPIPRAVKELLEKFLLEMTEEMKPGQISGKQNIITEMRENVQG